ncbi:MAG: hypothetical protein MUF18_16045 [Fimbriiglobus sp.]|nr:hypothetical protein [Fimbriiglobus sp.]
MLPAADYLSPCCLGNPPGHRVARPPAFPSPSRTSTAYRIDSTRPSAERDIHGLPDPTDGRQLVAPLVAEFGRSVLRKAGEHHTAVVLLNVNRVLAGRPPRR